MEMYSARSVASLTTDSVQFVSPLCFASSSESFQCGRCGEILAAGAGRSLGGSLSASWFSECFNEDALVTDLENLQVLGTRWRVKYHAVAWARLHQRLGQRRQPADVVTIQIDLVGADDAH